MMMKSIHTLTLLTAMLGGLLIPAGSAAGQSEQELRREVERLREHNRELERELDEARRQIQTLENAIERLNERLLQLREARPDRPVDEEEVTIDETVPHASPRALMSAMQASYAEAMANIDIGEEGDRQRALYVRAVERWRGRINRELRSSIAWHVRVLETEETNAGYSLHVVAVDPKTDVRLGEPFDMQLPRRVARRYEQLVERRQADRLQVRGVLVPEVQINPDRRDPGPFNVPPLIGPFAEFGFRIDPTAVLRPGDEE